jgi:hypothetical protein
MITDLRNHALGVSQETEKKAMTDTYNQDDQEIFLLLPAIHTA